MLRRIRTVGLSVGVMLLASLATPSVTGMAAVPQGSRGCADTTPLRHLPGPGASTASITDPATLAALGSYKALHDTESQARARAASLPVSAQKLSRLTSGALRPAANVSQFASREAAVQACGGVSTSPSLGAKVAQAARGLAPDAYACQYPTACWPGVAFVQGLDHQDEGGNGTWCGPATVSMIAITEPGPSYVTQPDARNYITNYQGVPVEQIGSNADAVVSALNHYVAVPNLGSNFYAWVSVSYVPTSQERTSYHNRLVVDILYIGYVVGGNTYEVAGSQYPHLPGHPTTLDIRHYIAIGGYDENQGTDYFSDSATGVPGWGPNVPAYSWYSEYNLVTIIGGGGYIW